MDPATRAGEKVEKLGHYLIVWAGLLLLTGLTFGLSFVDMGAGSIVVALCIAVTKAMLVMVFFMHLLHEHGAARLTMATAVLLVMTIAVLTIADAKTRFSPAIAGEGPAVPSVWRPAGYSEAAPPITPNPKGPAIEPLK